MPKLPARSLLLPLLLCAGCATSSQLIEDSLTTPDAVAAVSLGQVRFDYAQWTNRDEKDVATAKQHEATWAKALGDAFLARANRRGLGGTEGRAAVDITIIDLEPGSRAARYFVGFGAGSGLIAAKVDVAGHGSFRMNGKITGGAWGGNFVGVMEELGESIADHLAKRAGK